MRCEAPKKEETGTLKKHWKIHQLLLGAFAVAAFAAIAASPAVAKPTPKPESTSACPGSKGTGLPTANNVGASVTTDGTTNKYFFESFEAETQTSPGVPGLIKYCVYPDAGVPGPNSVVAKYDSWLKYQGKKGSTNFGFTRPGGNETNIPLDGTSHEVGIATWPTGQAPTEEEQTIVLHINDETECHRLYGPGTPVTCFVLPGEPPGPQCGAGNEEVAFNNYPFDIIQACPARTSFAFEGNVGTEEYGNGVVLDATVGAQIKKLTVPFYSFACGTSGHWNTGATEPCVTSLGAEFGIPANPLDLTDPSGEGGVLARLYAVANGDEVGALLGTARYTGEFPYRPSADSVNCTGSDVGKWFNEEMEPPTCRNSYGKLIPFDFSGQTGAKVPADKQVIWTVSFNTTSSGYFPLGALECRTENGGNPGCGYDSLNVGADKTYNAGTPFAGADMETSTLYYKRTGSGWPSPQVSVEDPGEAPLAQIETE